MSQQQLVSAGKGGISPATKAILRWQAWQAERNAQPDASIRILFLPSLRGEKGSEEVQFLKELAAVEPLPLEVMFGWSAVSGQVCIESELLELLQAELGAAHTISLYEPSSSTNFDLLVGVVGPRGAVGHFDEETALEQGKSFVKRRASSLLRGITWSEAVKAHAFCLFQEPGEDTASSVEALSLREDSFNPAASILRGSDTRQFSALFVTAEQLARNKAARKNLDQVLERKAAMVSADRLVEKNPSREVVSLPGIDGFWK